MADESKAHELICRLKGLAVELGRTPHAREFYASGVTQWSVRQAFKSFEALRMAAGLDEFNSKPRRVDNSIFERDIEQHLKEYAPKKTVDHGPWPTLAIISDIHWPFANGRVLEVFYRYIEVHKPEWVIINGDAWDMYSHSKYPRSHNVFTPREEQAKARAMNEEFWKHVKTLSPQSRCVQLMGNHELRPLKRIMEAYPEAEDWIAEKLRSLFTFDGVETIFDAREELMVREDIAVFHGFRSKLGDHMNTTLLHCFNGHTHKGGSVARRIRGQTLTETNSGLAGDPQAKGLTYTPQKITDWTPGFAACDAWGPRFIPVG